MKCDSKLMRLYAVTDRAWVGTQTLKQQVESSLKGGVSLVQLREKDMSDEQFLEEAFEIKTLCHEYNVPFIINDNVDIAIKCGADGIHVGQDDMYSLNVRERIGENMILGVSVHSVEQALEAQKNGADYLGVGAVFTTSTKPDADFVDYNTLKGICDAVSIPVVAIGGIYGYNILKLSGSGVDGVALVSAIFSVSDIESECKELRALSDEMVSL